MCSISKFNVKVAKEILYFEISMIVRVMIKIIKKAGQADRNLLINSVNYFFFFIENTFVSS